MPINKCWKLFVCAGFFALLSTSSLPAIDNWDLGAPDDDTSGNTRNVLIPGDASQRHDVEAISGVADQDWYRLVVVSGHSYEVRVGGRQEDCFDFEGTNFQVFESDGTTLITTGVDYPGIGIISSYRATFVAPSSNNVFVQLVGATTCTAPAQYEIQVFDTTLLSPFFSTFSNFESFYRILNTTNATINGTLTFSDSSGNTLATQSVMISAGGTAPTINTGPTGLNIPDNQAGPVRFSHDGPAGGILIDAFLGNFGVFPPVVLPLKIDRGWKGD
jgi:hypothetical protein